VSARHSTLLTSTVIGTVAAVVLDVAVVVARMSRARSVIERMTAAPTTGEGACRVVGCALPGFCVAVSIVLVVTFPPLSSLLQEPIPS